MIPGQTAVPAAAGFSFCGFPARGSLGLVLHPVPRQSTLPAAPPWHPVLEFTQAEG